ncbi:fungal-specific transcription factor domain-containing protein [Aspergillus unguis]
MPTTKAKRRHATMACVSCRESKIKCDGAEPACSHCANRNRECRYQAFDKRKLPLRVAIELLSSRVSQLCCFMRENGLQPPPMPQEKDTALKKVLDVLGLAEINSALTKSIASISEQNLARDEGTSTGILNPLPGLDQTEQHPSGFTGPRRSDDSFAIPLAVESDPPDILPYQDIPEIDTDNGASPGWPLETNAGFVRPHDASIPAALEQVPDILDPLLADDDSTLVEDSSSPESIEGLVDELSDRVGTLHIGPGGQTQFYGPTSTFNLADMLATTNPTTHLAQNDALECLSRFGGYKSVPAALEEHLTNLYFSWQDPAFHVVDRRMYEEAKAKWYAMADTPYYSESLRHAICALGASYETRYHPNFVTFPKSLVDFFEDRARALLEVEIDCACVATVQALVICSSLEVGNGREARGWLYSGMAVRLAFNLALHVDMSSHVSNGIITSADADLRRTVFWAAYTVDHQLGFHLGRPFRTNMDDVTVGKPSNNTSATHWDSDNWFPYTSPNSTTYAGSGVPDSMEEVCEAQITLCEIMAPCGDFLYGTSSISKSVLQQLNVEVVRKLLTWKSNLSQPLQINLDDHSTPYTPQVLLLHMQYHQNIIYAHRPWMSKSHTGIQPQPPQGPGHNHAREMCIQSATAIAIILRMYEARYTLRRIHTKAVAFTASAVLLLLFANVTRHPVPTPNPIGRGLGREDVQAHLSTCFRALDEFAVCWPSAAKAKDLLLRLQRRWEIRTRSAKGNWSAFGAMGKQASYGLNELGSEALGATHSTTENQQNVNMNNDINWMLMPDETSPTDSRAADLYTLLSNPLTMHPERGSI